MLLARRLLAEGVGSALLLVAVIGSGIAAQRLSPADAGLQLLENAFATGLALVALLLALGPVSGAHLNPVVTLVEAARRRMPLRAAGLYVVAQAAGAAAGAVLANAMFDLPLVQTASRHRAEGAAWLSEAVATVGLLLTIHGALASSGARGVAVAVGCYVGAAYWFTSSTAFANPAVTVARTLSDTFAGIHPSSVPTFVGAQALGGALGYLLLAGLLPGWRVPLRSSDGAVA